MSNSLRASAGLVLAALAATAGAQTARLEAAGDLQPTFAAEPVIPGASREVQESELRAQATAGCPTTPLEARALHVLTPILRGLVEQSQYQERQSKAPPPQPNQQEWARVSATSSRLSEQVRALYLDPSPIATQALAYLLRVRFLYSDFDDDNVDCSLWERREVAKQTLAGMRRCVPITGLEPYPHQMVLPMPEVRQRIANLSNACSRHEGE
jgi:hypothetical protein